MAAGVREKKQMTSLQVIRVIQSARERLLRHVKLGDERGAADALREIMSGLLVAYSERVDLVKGELLLTLAASYSAALELAAPQQDLVESVQRFARKLLFSRTVEDACLVSEEALLRIAERVVACRRPRGLTVLSSMIEYINAHYAEPITLSHLAGVAGLNPSYLSHAFKRVAGCSLSEYMRRLRVERAKDLLAGTTLTVREVAERVGVPDAAYFSRIFRRLEGVSPQQYRIQSGAARKLHHDAGAAKNNPTNPKTVQRRP
ncbi:MAG: helix-turn-helix domain-containing protein [Bacillota bacterium]